MSGQKKPEPDFIVRLVAPGLRPWLVPMRSLARILAAVTRLVEQKDEEAEGGEASNTTESQPEGPPALNLLAIRSGSAEYAVSAPDRRAALAVIGEIGGFIKTPDRADWSEPTLSALRDLSEVAKSLKCEIEFIRLAKHGHRNGVIAKITPETYGRVSTSAFAYGQTSIYAKIERVGGAVEMHCGIRLPDSPRKMVICHVASEELVRELGQFMYQYVTLSGMASWLKRGWQLKHLKITSFEPPKTGSVLEALRLARIAGGSAWDDIDDPVAYLAEIRGE